eukprot:746816-Hanusia_phi.AAC.2
MESSNKKYSEKNVYSPSQAQWARQQLGLVEVLLSSTPCNALISAPDFSRSRQLRCEQWRISPTHTTKSNAEGQCLEPGQPLATDAGTNSFSLSRAICD